MPARAVGSSRYAGLIHGAGEPRPLRAASGFLLARGLPDCASGKIHGVSFESNGDSVPQRLFAVRGGTQVDAHGAEAIVAATEDLMRELIERNGLTPEAMVSCLFTTTED